MGSRTNIDRKDLWLHSIGSAMAAQMLARVARRADPETAFTACLLHDIGKLILDAFFGKEYRQVIDALPSGDEMFAAEERILGFSHGEVGGWICEFWKLPPELTFPITHHHHPERFEGPFENLAAVVQCADFICRCSGIGYGGHQTSEIKLGHQAAPGDAQEESLEQTLQSKRHGLTANALSVAAPMPLKSIAMLKAGEEELNRVLQDLMRGKEKAYSFVNAVS
jgi:putative nucleotidyltransferase with HDIG domain